MSILLAPGVQSAGKPCSLGRLVVGLVSLVVAWAALAGSSLAQDPRDLPAPIFMSVDENGVDLGSGRFNVEYSGPSVGQPDAGLKLDYFYLLEIIHGSTLTGLLDESQYGVPWPILQDVSFGKTSVQFLRNASGSSTLFKGRGGETMSGTSFTDRDGTRVLFGLPVPGYTEYKPTSVIRPNGERLTLTYYMASGSPVVRSIVSNLGWMIHVGGSDVTALNLAVDYCAPDAATCTFSQQWPILDRGGGTIWQDGLGRTTYVWRSYDAKSGEVQRPTQYGTSTRTAITYGTDASGNFTEGNTNGGRVVSITNSAGTWTYSWKRNKTTGSPDRKLYVRRTSPTGQILEVQTQEGSVLYRKDELGRISTATLAGFGGRIASQTTPEGITTTFTYDSRGNITQVRRTPKTGSGLSQTTWTASYPTSCANPLTCNQPDYIVDERGNRTDFTYHAQSGMVATRTDPAGSNGVRPQIRNTYSQLNAVFKNASGQPTPSTTAVWRLTESSACMTAASCVGTADEVRTLYTYDANLLQATVTVRSGDNALSTTTTNTYDGAGNLILTDGPLAGTADMTRRIYDRERQLIGTVEPDPDGAGGRLFPATRTAYDANGSPTTVEKGTTTNAGANALSTFSALQMRTTTYDLWNRPLSIRLAAGGQSFSYSQNSYGALGRLTCATVRMNDAAFGSTADACALGPQGAYGPDRITRHTYDAVGQLLTKTTGYGTTGARVAITQSWTPAGLVDWIEDALGNRSDYIYDGFDRLSQLRYPMPTVGAHAANPSDYEQYGYDAGGNVVSFRNRAGQTIATTWDALGRKSQVTPPSGTSAISYTYDNFDRQLTSTAAGQTLTSTWDVLGRKRSEAGSLGAYAWAYDLAGRRTRITWPDGFYADYDYDLSNLVTRIRENGATSGAGVLANYTYDNLGRRTAVTRGNGVSTSYGYDGASRLTSLAHDLPSTANDVAWTYGFSPAGQIVSRTTSNSAFVYSPAAGTTAYANNGRNQVTSAGGAAVTYDARQNVATDGTNAYVYDALNRLTAVTGVATYSYDPDSRLFQESATAAYRFRYEADQPLAAYSSTGAVFNRFIPGPRVDERAGWHSENDTRYWQITDERGSIVANLDASGAILTAPLRYDEYGQAGTASQRFGFTGQMRLADTPLYHYKTRTYSPALGRFLQTDPAHYDAGLNLYVYVKADPVNLIDPLGEDAWLVARPVYFMGVKVADHMFVVVADQLGAPPRARFSYGPSQGLNPADRGREFGSLVSLTNTLTQTDVDDKNFWDLTSNPVLAALRGVRFIQINAPDEAVIAAGTAVDEALGTPDDPGSIEYQPIPRGNEGNSNAAAVLVGTLATGGSVRTPPTAHPVGASQADEVEAQLCFPDFSRPTNPQCAPKR